MDTTTTTKCSYRKTKKGEWVVMGPASIITDGATVTVTKKSGETKTETIASTGKTFGDDLCYGYLDKTSSSPRPRPYGGYREPSRHGSCPTDGNCSSFGNGKSCGSYECDGW